MRIGFDISQLAYSETGVSSYLKSLLENLLAIDKKNEYILLFSSMRRNFELSALNLRTIPPNVRIKKLRLPPTLLDLLWNRLHVLPLERLIGNVDVFITSDWTEPPVKRAKKGTIIYDLIVYKQPEETHKKIVDVQKRKLSWVKKESDFIISISESTKKDIEEILGIPQSKIKVVYPGA